MGRRLATVLLGVVAGLGLVSAGPAAADPGPPGASCGITQLCLVQNANGSLTAWGYYDVSLPDPNVISVWNATTGSRLTYCVSGTSCTTAPGFAIRPPVGACHTYVAFIGPFSSVYQPPYVRKSGTRQICNPGYPPIFP